MAVRVTIIGFQPSDLSIELIEEYKPAFMLFSGGGNDVVGDGLNAFINHTEFEGSLGLLRNQHVDYMIDMASRGANLTKAHPFKRTTSFLTGNSRELRHS